MKPANQQKAGKSTNTGIVVLVVRKEDLKENEGGTFSLRTKPLHKRKLHATASLADDFPFRKASSCYCLGTGFFVRQDVIATAAHVVFPAHENLKLSDLRFVRGIKKDSDFTKIEAHQIYRPKPQPEHTLPADYYRLSQFSEDWALIPIKLEKEHKNRPVILPTINSQDTSIDSGIYSIGHSYGLSIKQNNTNGKILASVHGQAYFECYLPAMASCSGAPVFRADTHELIGMIIRGVNQFEIIDEKICLRENGSKWEGEECQRLEVLQSALAKFS